MVVGKYTQTKQRWLKGKIVKFGHGRHYKKTFTMPRTRGGGGEGKQGKNMKGKTEKKESRKARKMKKIRKKTKKQRKDNTIGMHQ